MKPNLCILFVTTGAAGQTTPECISCRASSWPAGVGMTSRESWYLDMLSAEAAAWDVISTDNRVWQVAVVWVLLCELCREHVFRDCKLNIAQTKART